MKKRIKNDKFSKTIKIYERRGSMTSVNNSIQKIHEQLDKGQWALL